MAAYLAAEWVWTAYRRQGASRVTGAMFWAISFGFCAVFVLLFLQLLPPHDLSPQFGQRIPRVMLLRALQQIREAFFGGMGGALYKLVSTTAALIVVLLSSIWFRRRSTLSLYLGLSIPLLLLALLKATYWHAGILFLAWIFALWVAFEARPVKPENVSGMMILTMGVVFAVQAVFGLASIWHGMHHVYSGSRAAAEYLRRSGEERQNLFAVGFKAFALQPYFNHNLFAAQEHGRKEAFYLWSVAFEHKGLERLDEERPDKVIAGVAGPEEIRRLEELRSHGYCEERDFPGAIWWKNGELEPDTYVILGQCNIHH